MNLTKNPLNCDECGRQIGFKRTHNFFGENAELLLCPRCLFPQKGSTKRLHQKHFPMCLENWHDVWDHGKYVNATRAAANLIRMGKWKEGTVHTEPIHNESNLVSIQNDKAHALYRFYGGGGTLLYIGLTANLPTRLSDHRDDKPWWTGIANITVEHYLDRPTVIEAERRAIIAEKPLYNIQHNRIQSQSTYRNNEKCPACQKSAYYMSELDRYVHSDGSPNDACWLTLLRGEGSFLHHQRYRFGGSQSVSIRNWTFESNNGHRRTEPIWLYWEVNGDPISDDFDITDMSALELWQLWRARFSDLNAETIFGSGAVSISWFIEGERVFEAAPFQDRRVFEYYMRTVVGEVPEPFPKHFLTSYTWPEDSNTGERLEWARLPVIDKVWRNNNLPQLYTTKGGFIQELTGWKPSPFQSYVNVHMLENSIELS